MKIIKIRGLNPREARARVMVKWVRVKVITIIMYIFIFIYIYACNLPMQCAWVLDEL